MLEDLHASRKGPVAVVTGAASGIGKACAESLLADGWRVFALDQEVQDGLTGERLTTLVCDVGDESSIARTFAEIAREASGVDAMVCSAGVLRMGRLLEMSSEDFDTLFRVNTRGPWLCMKYAAPLLRHAATEEDPARVVVLGSIASLRPKVGGGAYAASKAALSRLVRVMAAEVAADHILVNAVAPGTVDTPMVRPAMQPGGRSSYRVSGSSPLGRIAQPNDVVAAIRLLLSPGANYITGTWLPVDGGTSAAFLSGG